MKTRLLRLNHPIYLLLYIDITRQSVIFTSALLRQGRAYRSGHMICWRTQQKPIVVRVIIHLQPCQSQACRKIAADHVEGSCKKRSCGSIGSCRPHSLRLLWSSIIPNTNDLSVYLRWEPLINVCKCANQCQPNGHFHLLSLDRMSIKIPDWCVMNLWWFL